MRDAGSAWRDENARYTEPDLDRITGGRRRVLLPIAAAVAVVTLVVAGVLALRGAKDDQQSAAGLVGPVWKLDGGGASTFVIGRDGRLVADDECSLIGGRARIDGNRLAVDDLSDRSKNCTDTYDPYFGRIFERPLNVTVDGEHATLVGSGRTLRATKAPQLAAPTADVPTFTDTVWRLASVTPKGMSTQTFPNGPTLQVRKGRMTYNDTCADREVRLTVVGERARPGTYDSNSACAGGTALGAISSILENPFTWKVDGDRLTLQGQGGTLGYRWVPRFFPAVDPSRLVGPTWRLTSIAGKAADQPVTLRFPTLTTYELVVRCGVLRGNAQIGVGTISLPSLKGTCAEPVVSILPSAASWHIADGRLIVGGGGAQGLSLVLTGRPSDPAERLIGVWNLNGIEDSAGIAPVEVGVALKLEAGRAVVYGTCVPRGSAYRVTGDRIVLKSSGAQAACGDGGGPASDLYGATSDGTLAWSVQSSSLRLRDGARTFVFTRANESAPTGRWRLQSAEQDDAGSSSGQGGSNTGVVLTLSGGRLTLTGTCSPRSGIYRTDPVELTIDRRGERDCLSGGVARLADEALTGTLNWSVREQILTLRKGSTTLTFTR
ncbi:hypothetical protein GCM10027265_19220 [Jatrophihabitans fulvus]